MHVANYVYARVADDVRNQICECVKADCLIGKLAKYNNKYIDLRTVAGQQILDFLYKEREREIKDTLYVEFNSIYITDNTRKYKRLANQPLKYRKAEVKIQHSSIPFEVKNLNECGGEYVEWVRLFF